VIFSENYFNYCSVCQLIKNLNYLKKTFRISLLLQPENLVVLSQSEIVVLTLAISADSFTTSWFSGALHKKLGISLGIKLPFVFSVGRTLFMITGVTAGLYLASVLSDYSYMMGLSMLMIPGIKLILESLNFNPEEKVILVDNTKTMILLTLATSVNSLFAGIGLGLIGIGLFMPGVVTLVSVAVLSFAGITTGRIFGYKPTIRFAGLAAGVLMLIIILRLMFLNFI
jgi:manganese efflux pump family protein